MVELKEKLIYRQLAKINKELKAVAKEDNGKYKSQTVWNIINMIGPLLRKYEVFPTRERLESQIINHSSNFAYLVCYRYYFTAIDGSQVFTDSEGLGIKGQSPGKEVNTAQQYAMKYAYIQSFLIPDSIENSAIKTQGSGKKSRLEADYQRMIVCYKAIVKLNPKINKPEFAKSWMESTADNKIEFEKRAGL